MRKHNGNLKIKVIKYPATKEISYHLSGNIRDFGQRVFVRFPAFGLVVTAAK
jgi:hypothetical protein